MRWRCGVCDGVNQGGETCAICGASRAAAVPLDAPPATPSRPPRPDRTPVRNTAPQRRDRTQPGAAPPEPPRPRGIFRRLVDAAARAVERAIAPPQPSDEPPPDRDAEPRPRRRSRMRVRPFPFGILVTWENEPENESE